MMAVRRRAPTERPPWVPANRIIGEYRPLTDCYLAGYEVGLTWDASYRPGGPFVSDERDERQRQAWLLGWSYGWSVKRGLNPPVSDKFHLDDPLFDAHYARDDRYDDA